MKNDCQRNKNLEWIPDILKIVEAVGIAIVDIQQRNAYRIESKLDNSPVTEADLLAHEWIEKGLRALDPTIPILSEEGKPVPKNIRLSWSKYWLVDPLDGTRAFIQGSDEFTVNIALIENHVPVLGVIGVPRRGELYWAAQGEGAYCQQAGELQRLITSKSDYQPKRILASQFLPTQADSGWSALLARLIPYEFRYCSSSLKICLVAKGEAELYPRMGKTYEWDLAAGHCILEEAGGQMVDLTGKVLRYNLGATLENAGFYAVAGSDLISICCG